MWWVLSISPACKPWGLEKKGSQVWRQLDISSHHSWLQRKTLSQNKRTALVTNIQSSAAQWWPHISQWRAKQHHNYSTRSWETAPTTTKRRITTLLENTVDRLPVSPALRDLTPPYDLCRHRHTKIRPITKINLKMYGPSLILLIWVTYVMDMKANYKGILAFKRFESTRW